MRHIQLSVFGGDRIATATAVSTFINAVLGLGQIIFGIYSGSHWFLINALYFLVICIARMVTIRGYMSTQEIDGRQERRKRGQAVFKRCGAFICLVGISYFFVCLRMFLVGDATVASGLAVYFIATVAFTKIGFALHGVISTRSSNNLIVVALKRINLMDAAVSIVVTQCTLLTMESIPEAQSSSALVGMTCSAMFLILGLTMLFGRKRSTTSRTRSR